MRTLGLCPTWDNGRERRNLSQENGLRKVCLAIVKFHKMSQMWRQMSHLRRFQWENWIIDYGIFRSGPTPRVGQMVTTLKGCYRPSMNLVSNTWFASASFFIGLFCWKICRKLRSRKVDDRVFSSCWMSFQHWALVGSMWDQSNYRSLFDESAGNSFESLLTEGYSRVFQGGLWHFANSADRRTVTNLNFHNFPSRKFEMGGAWGRG